MEDRMARMELLMEASAHLNQTMLQNQEILRANHRQIEENLRRNEENWRRMEQNNLRLEEQMQESRDLLQQILQTVALMQADIVRIDETRA